ncbi:hypothetical protein [Mycolicibacterium sp.]|uniref:hypothetical protein n=1 Tax=Mycolicibacterium sp. TaxID=2320850 RepID=UPI00355E1BD7
MSEFTTLQGFTAAVSAAADLDVCDADAPPEYTRGAVEVIANAFVRSGNDPDAARHYVERAICDERLRSGR